jgi:hypothetical protein
MKSIASLIGLCFLLLAEGQTQIRRAPSLQPTALEAFARQSAAHVVWSSEVGRLDSREAHAIVTVLVLENSAQPQDRVGGIRIDLSSPDLKDAVYLGEETLVVYKNALDEIGRNARGSRNTARDDLAPGGTSYLGSGIFWNPDNKPCVHALNATYYFASDSEGLYLSAAKDTGFRFPDQDPSQLSGAIARAIDRLSSH